MDCCNPAKTLAQVVCPQCNARGKAVSFVTVSSLLSPTVASLLEEGSRWICQTLTCSVLYYGEQGQTVDKGQALVRVGCKETQDPIPLCYCFDVTRADIQQEVTQTGHSNIQDRITKDTREGRCDCERKNPAGVCCLGDIRAAVKAAMTFPTIQEKHQ